MHVAKMVTGGFKKMMLSVCALFLFSGVMWAQNIQVTGKVTDRTGDGIPGVYVLVEGTQNGTTSNVDGSYTIAAPSDKRLVFSLLGMETQYVSINNRSVINVQMAESSLLLDEIIVTAMGIKKEKKALGYAVQDIKADELMKNKNANVINSLSGKIAGVNITQSGGAAGAGSSIIIRGGTSLERDNQPVFVVDGVIFDNSTPIGGNSGFDGTTRTSSTNSNRIMDVNPEDIENMSVLKGPAAAALYGSRAAAGVVIITTKKGAEGRAQVNFSTKFTGNWANRFPEQQGTYIRGYYETSGNYNDYSTQSWGPKATAGQTMYNNIEDFFQKGHSFDNNISISGGGRNSSYYLSASRLDQKGIVRTTGYDRTTVRFNGEQKHGLLTVGANMSYTIANTDKTLTSSGLYNSGGGGAMESVYRWSRSDEMKHYLNEDGTKYRMFADRQPLESDIENPYWILYKNKFTDQTHRFNGTVTASMKIADWFDINYRAGYDNYTLNTNNLQAPGGALRITYQDGKMSDTDYTYEYLSSNLMLNFHKAFGDFDFNLLLGQTMEDTKTRNEMRNGWGFIIKDFYSYNNIPAANQQFDSHKSEKRLMGVYGDFRVSYKNIAYLSFTGRNDWSSTLPKDNRSYFYPSVSGSLVFTELLPKNNILSFGKLRGSWARVGKDTDAYVTATTLWPSQNFLGGLGVGNEWQRGNPYLKPEMTDSYEVGLDVRFFNGRLGLDYTFYSNDSYNQIVVPRLSQTTGYILLSTNVGRILNKGMELSVNIIPVQNKKITWDMTINLSGNRGSVKDLLTGQDVLYVTDVQVGTAKAASFNTLYDKDGNVTQKGLFNGISGSRWTRDPEGNIVVDSSTGLPLSDGITTRQVGNREPTFIGGFNNNIQYKNWNLSFLFDFRVGGDIYNGTDYFMTTNGMSKRSENRESVTINGVVNTGTTSNPVYEARTTTYEAGKMYDIKGVMTSGESMIRSYFGTLANETVNYITKTNLIRLRSISLSYDFTSMLRKQNVIKTLSASVSGTNLWLLTNYKGLDPETSAAGSGVVGSSSTGIDYCGVPATAGLSFGINIGF